MAVTSFSTTGFDKLLLEFVKPGLEKQFYTNTKLYDRFKTRPETVYGKYGVIKVSTSGAQSARPSSSTSFPTAQAGGYNEFHFYLKRGMYGSLQFDNLTAACSKGAGAVKELVRSEVDNIEATISNRMNKQFWGDGSGRLCQVAAAVSNSATVTVDSPIFGIDSNDYTAPSLLLEADLHVDIYDTSGNLEAEDVTISSISEGGAGTDTLTMSAALTCSNNAWVFLHDTYASSEAAGTGTPMGLWGIVTTANPYVGITATTAFQNINRSNDAWAQAQVFDMGTSAAAPAVITNKKMLEVVQKVENYGKVDVIITNGIIWRNYYSILEADKTLPNEKVFWGGTSGLAFYGGRGNALPIIWDDDCPDQSMLFLDSSKIVISAPSKGGMEWVPGDTGHILTRVQGKDEVVANLRWYYQMTTSKPKALGKLQYIKHDES